MHRLAARAFVVIAFTVLAAAALAFTPTPTPTLTRTPTATPTPAGTPLPAHTLLIRVVNDLNSDGKVDAGEPGLANWRVTGGCGDGIVPLTTDANGDIFIPQPWFDRAEGILGCFRVDRPFGWLPTRNNVSVRIPADWDTANPFIFGLHDLGRTVMELYGEVISGGLPAQQGNPGIEAPYRACGHLLVESAGAVVSFSRVIVEGVDTHAGCPRAGDRIVPSSDGVPPTPAPALPFAPGIGAATSWVSNGDSMRFYNYALPITAAWVLDPASATITRDCLAARDLEGFVPQGSQRIFVLSDEARHGCGAPGRPVQFFSGDQRLAPGLDWRAGDIGDLLFAFEPARDVEIGPPDTGSAGLLPQASPRSLLPRASAQATATPTASPASPAPTATPFPPDAAVVRIRVINDLNGDGVAQASEPGLPGWQVEAVSGDVLFGLGPTDALGTIMTASFNGYEHDGVVQGSFVLERQLGWRATTATNIVVAAHHGQVTSVTFLVHDLGRGVMETGFSLVRRGIPASARFTFAPPFDRCAEPADDRSGEIIIVGGDGRSGCPRAGDKLTVLADGEAAGTVAFAPGTQNFSWQTLVIGGDSMRFSASVGDTPGTWEIDRAVINGHDCGVFDLHLDFPPRLGVYVLSDEARSGCGVPGSIVTLYRNGVPLAPTLVWKAGWDDGTAGSLLEQLHVISPPNTGSGGLLHARRDAAGAASQTPALAIAAAIAGTLALVASRRRRA
jgi:hypothetical protein